MLQRTGRALIALMVVFAFGFSPVHAVEMAINGSFDDTNGPTGPNPPSAGTAPFGWTISGTVDWLTAAAFDVVPAITDSPDGGPMAAAAAKSSPESPEALSQSISGFVVGQKYTVSFYQINRGLTSNWLDDGNFKVTLFETDQFSPSMSFEGFGSQTWSSLISLTFTATTEISTLTFTANRTSTETLGPYLNIDGVSVVQSVPEPTSLAALVSLGLLGVCVAARRRRRAV